MATTAPARSRTPAPRPSDVVPRPVREDGTMLWTRARYDRAIDAGILTPDDEVELLDGLIVAKMPQNTPHEVATGLVSDALRSAFGSTAHTRDEKSVALSDLSRPEPDIAVVRGERRAFVQVSPAPADVLLLVEVADSSLTDDRTWKEWLYADAMIAEYWIVNLRDRELEVYRDPAGGAYRSKATLGASASVTPLNAPDASIAVSDLLP